MMRRILCVMSDAGSAHRAISNAVRDVLQRSYSASAFTYEMDDIFLVSKFCDYFIKLYPRLIKYSPTFYKGFYHLTNRPYVWSSIYHIFIAPLMKEKIKKLIIQKRPDIILSVFALSGRIVVDALDELGLLNKVPVIIIVVDLFSIHFTWAEPRATLVIVPTEEAKEQLAKYGVPADKLSVIELPINPRFSEDIGLSGFKKEIGMMDDRFTVMVMGGGDGTGGIDQIVNILRKTDLNIQMIVVAGRNESLRNKINRLKNKSNIPIKVFGFTDMIPELMGISDILITKAGPMTIMEAFSKELPVIITGFIPGQEEGNVEYIKSKNLGYVVSKKSEVVDIIRRSIGGGSDLELIKANIRERRKISGARKVADIIMSKSFQNRSESYEKSARKKVY